MNLIYIILTFFGVTYIYQYKNSKSSASNDQPLILTDYLNNGQADLARQLSSVKPFVGNVESYSGFFRVSDDCVREMFFWYFPAQNGNTAAPLLVWLQGGPGSSSLYGLFVEHGPYYVKQEDASVHLREVAWTNEYNMIYIDNPAGVGFSFSNSSCYSKDEIKIGIYLSKVMEQFYQLFPTMRSNPLYITGESYAGKYVPVMVHAIHEFNQNNPTPMNLVGMLIGDGYIDPYYMNDFGQFLNHIGLIFDNQIAGFDNYNRLMQESISRGNFTQATRYADKAFELYWNLTGLTDYYDYYADREAPYDAYIDFVNLHSQDLHAGNMTFADFNEEVYYSLYEDETKSVGPIVQEIINAGYKTLLFSGQFDIIVPYPFTSSFLRHLEWNGKELFTWAPQVIWRSTAEPSHVYGYVRSGGNLMQIIVRNAGHMVPMDQPDAAMDMLKRFIYDLGF